MCGVLLAERTVFLHFDPVRVILFIFGGCIVALFAVTTRQNYAYSQFRHLLIQSIDAYFSWFKKSNHNY